MAFQRAQLRLARKTATGLLRAGLALGLERQRRNKKDCGGLSRSSRRLPHLRLPAPQLPSSLAAGCLHCGRHTAGRWIYGGKVCNNCYKDNKCRLVKGVLLVKGELLGVRVR
jgi:hypothetical protein